jgi:hypothetical protein
MRLRPKSIWLHQRFARLGSVLVITALTVSCSYFNPYVQRGPHMLESPHAKLCWVPKGSLSPAHQGQCQSDPAYSSLRTCLDQLEQSSHWYTPIENVDTSIMRCMNGEGWDRAIVDGYIVTPG